MRSYKCEILQHVHVNLENSYLCAWMCIWNLRIYIIWICQHNFKKLSWFPYCTHFCVIETASSQRHLQSWIYRVLQRQFDFCRPQCKCRVVWHIWDTENGIQVALQCQLGPVFLNRTFVEGRNSTLVAEANWLTIDGSPIMPCRIIQLAGKMILDGSKNWRSVAVFWYERLVSINWERWSFAVLMSKPARPTCKITDTV